MKLDAVLFSGKVNGSNLWVCRKKGPIFQITIRHQLTLPQKKPWGQMFLINLKLFDSTLWAHQVVQVPQLGKSRLKMLSQTVFKPTPVSIYFKTWLLAPSTIAKYLILTLRQLTSQKCKSSPPKQTKTPITSTWRMRLGFLTRQDFQKSKSIRALCREVIVATPSTLRHVSDRILIILFKTGKRLENTK